MVDINAVSVSRNEQSLMDGGIANHVLDTPVRKRPKPGERRIQILRTLSQMLEKPGADRITTAALAAQIDVSEAALYRHFASKAQMFESLIDFIETSVFEIIEDIAQKEPSGSLQAQQMVEAILSFGEKNPGMARVMGGDALVFENERLLTRMNHLFDRVETRIKASLMTDDGAPSESDAQAQSSALCSFILGRLHRYARTNFQRLPTEHIDASLKLLMN